MTWIAHLGKVRHAFFDWTYTTSNAELLENFDILQNWITKNHIKQTSTVLEVKSLFETLKVELEATVVK